MLGGCLRVIELLGFGQTVVLYKILIMVSVSELALAGFQMHFCLAWAIKVGGWAK